MKLPDYLKPFPKFKIVNFNAEYSYVSYKNKYIFLKPDLYNDLFGNNPKPFSVSVFKHEEFHLNDLKKVGTIIYMIMNSFSRKFRFEHEVQAYKEGFRYLKKSGEKPDIDKIAKDFSGRKYFHVTNYKNAKKVLEKTWNEI